MNIIFGQQTQFEYINYKGIKSTRNVIPMSLYFGATEFHPENQWLIVAYDLDRQCERTFALKDIVVGSFADNISQLSRKQHEISITHNPIPTPIPQHWSKYSKCLVCGEYHDNGNLPCPYGKFASGK
ncbi:hypothetical protein vBAcePPAc_0162 [Aeromonas phage vB_AceP_PAc]|nr:hypothetical protein vBAcePPAc_0162 [Aeromonas phage vB_AceP_PAc]